MKRLTIIFTVILVLAAAAAPLLTTGDAQTRNQSSKVQLTEFFVFPNECTNELMDVYDTTTVTCHDSRGRKVRSAKSSGFVRTLPAPAETPASPGTAPRHSKTNSSPPNQATSALPIAAKVRCSATVP